MPSRRTAVAPAVERVLRSVKGSGLTAEQLDDLAVAVAEALSNAAVHGNSLRPHLQVRVKVEVIPRKQVTLEVRDSGHGFDVASVSDPTHPARLLVPGGRGIFLMRRLVDRLDYNPAGNVVRMTIQAHPPRSSRRPRRA